MFEGIRFLWHAKRPGSGDPSTTREAAKGLGELGDIRRVEPLIVTLKDSDRFVRLLRRHAVGGRPHSASGSRLVSNGSLTLHSSSDTNG